MIADLDIVGELLIAQTTVAARNQAIKDCIAVIRKHQFTGAEEIAVEVDDLRSEEGKE